MTNTFHELLLSELRMVVYRPGDPAGLTDGLLCAAVTANENLRSLGYVLRPDDVVRLAVSPSLDGFYQAVKELVPDVKAKPIYPGFPKQVMEMVRRLLDLKTAARPDDASDALGLAICHARYAVSLLGTEGRSSECTTI